MKENDDRLTLQELETLCKMYMECRMSVLEEAELEYVLRTTGRTSAVIDETRQLMGISRKIMMAAGNKTLRPRRKFNPWLCGAAASVAILIAGISVFNFRASSYECVAYVSGREITGADARDIAEADMEKMQQFMHTVEAKQTEEEAKVDQFINHKSFPL